MNTIQDLFQQAQLAEAAYADFANYPTTAKALEAKGMSATQASAFVAQWRMVEQQPDMLSGFSATVFQNIATGEYTVTIRGTNEVITDWTYANIGGIGLHGMAMTQAVDVYNWMLRLTATQGQSVAQYQYIPESGIPGMPGYQAEELSLAGNITVTANGALAGQTFSVAGHSLGGHLAMVLGRLMPNQVSDIGTFNAPGFTSSVATDWFFSTLRQLEITANGNSQIGSSFLASITQGLNVQGDAVHSIGTSFGAQTTIFSESADTGVYDAHLVKPITDSLAVYNLLATLDPVLNTDPDGLTKITGILKASSNVAANSLEAAVSSLGKLFNVPGTTFNANEFDPNRDLLYKAVQDIAAALPKNVALSLVAVDAATILADAKAATPDALASRYALVNGNPFVVKGADYGTHNANGELDLFDPATHSGSLTNQYLTDRASYLKWELQANTQDKSVLLGAIAPNDWQYTDQATHGMLTVKGGLLAGQNPARQIVFGSEFGDDGSLSISPILQGGTQDDRLYGMGGDDTLQGNGGNDWLEGGQGTDTYVWNSGDGRDALLDTDGLGSIVIDGQTLGAGESKDGGRTYASTDAAGKRHTYTVLSGDIHSAAGATLLIDNAIEVRNYRKGDLGLTVGNAAPPQPLQAAQTTRDIAGDFGPMDFYDANGNVVYQYDDLGNLVTDPNKAGPRNDVLNDSAGNDHIVGGAGNDAIYLKRGGDDLVEAGSGDDFVSKTAGGNLTIDLGDGADRLFNYSAAAGTVNASGGWGRDWIEGGVGGDLLQGGMEADILAGGAGDDRLFGDSEATTEQAILNGNTDPSTGSGQVPTGLKGDWLSGNAGDDTLVTREGNDVLSGGGGNDLLISGAGDDYILGDADYSAQSLDWTVAQNGAGAFVFQPIVGADAPADSGADVVYAGDGADHVWAGAGNDVVYGEGGNDILLGEAGSDVLSGGAGDDILHGDASYLAAALHGNDYLDGGDGNDTLWGEGGDDMQLGGLGNDTLWGGLGNDTLQGDAGDDKLYGEQGANYLDGGDGHDILNSGGPGSTLMGGAGNDDVSAAGGGNTLDGGVGNDTLLADGGNNYLDGGEGINMLQASGGANSLFAGAGNDTLYAWGDGNYLDAGGGNNTLYAQGINNELYAGAGNDTIQATGGNNYLDGGDGINSLIADGGNNTLFAGLGNDTLQASGGNNYLDAGDGINTLVTDGGGNTMLSGAGDDYLSAMGGSNYLDAGAGNDYLTVDGAGNTLLGGAGDDQLYLWGTGNGSTLDGGAGNDILQGGSGNDTLTGGDGNDQLRGGAGNDTYVFNLGDGQDNISEYDLSAGNVDMIKFGAGITVSNIAFALYGTNLILGIAGTSDQITIQNWGYGGDIERFEFSDGTVWDTAQIQTFVSGTPTLAIGTYGNDYLQAAGVSSILQGQAGNDIISGSIGNDTLIGGTGDDSLFGGAGDDTYIFNQGDGKDTISDYSGVDTLKFGSGITANNITFSRSYHDLVLSISGTTDQITFMNWGSTVDNRIERIEFPDGTVWNSAQIQALIPSVQGTSGNDSLVLWAGESATVQGLAGNDNITGNDGNDTLIGGAGDDVIYGGTGNDTYVFNPGDGRDTIQEAYWDVGYIVGSAADVDTIRFGAGISASDVVFGSSGRDLVLGINGTGDQITVKEWGSDKAFRIERIEFSDGTVWDEAALKTMVNVASEQADVLHGTVRNDIMNGLGGNDMLYGYAGDDTLDGGLGNDVLDGGNGNDTYLFDVYGGQDVVQDYDTTAGNVDTVKFGSWEFPGNVTVKKVGQDLCLTIYNPYNQGPADTLTLKNWYVGSAYAIERVVFADGTVWDAQMLAAMASPATVLSDVIYGSNGNDNLNGLDGNDIIYAGDGNDQIDGGLGGDGLFGGAGDDSYVVDNTLDTVAEYFNEGVDSVQSSVTFALGANVENLTLTGTAAIDGTGNELDNVLVGNSAKNTLTGNAGNDTLDGGAGVDTMLGGIGNDTYVVDSTRDNVIENLGEGMDTVLSSVKYALANNVENLILTGTAAINGTGNALDNLLVGNAAGNDLVGNGGIDILQGGAGNDVLKDSAGNTLMDGDAGDDAFTGNAGNELFMGGAGNDTITTGGGADIIAFDRGDGQDTVLASTGLDNTISLGGGIDYQSLALSKSGNNLILDTGNGDQIILNNWYKGRNGANHSVANLQLVLDASSYDAASADPLLNQRVQEFNFDAIVQAFDQAMASSPTMTSWALTNSLLSAHLAGSDTDALGGELAYQYNLSGTLSGIGLASAQTVIGDANFGIARQQLQPLAGLQGDPVLLG